MSFENDSSDPAVQLPAREAEILSLAAKGMTDKEIGAHLGISPDTVGSYWRRILLRFDAANRTEAVALATESQFKSRVDAAEMESERLLQEMQRRVQSEAKTAESLAQLNTILNSFDTAVIFVDEERVIQFVNEAFCKEFMPDRYPEDVIGGSAKENLSRFINVFSEPETRAQEAEALITAGEAVRNQEIVLADGRRFLRDFYPLRRGDQRAGHLWKFSAIR